MAEGYATGDHHLIALGALGYLAGVFHMLNHAFFKGLLFLCSGSVIHCTGTEDMRLMGGLLKKIPVTGWTKLCGCISIAGVPIFSGFWSKDMVLEAAMNAGSNGETFFVVLFALGIVTAFMTAFYMFRMWFMTFTGEPGENAKHCHHESKIMVSPLVILAVFALFSGLLVFAGLGSLVENALTAMGFPSIEMETGEEIAEAIFSNVWTYVSIALALIGILLAYLMYTRKAINPGKFNRNGESALYKLLANRYFFPQLYDQISWKLGAGIAKGVDAFDRNIIDGTVNGLSNAVIGSGDVVSRMETGHVRDYATVVVAGVVVLILVFAIVFCAGGM